MGRRGYPPEFRRKVLDLLAAGRTVADVARDLQISPESIYAWRRQDRIDRGEVPGLSSLEKSELAVARRRIAQLEAEPERRTRDGLHQQDWRVCSPQRRDRRYRSGQQPQRPRLEVAMVTTAQFAAIAAQRGVELRRDPSAVIVATAVTADGLVEVAQEFNLIVLGLDGLQADGAVVVPLIDFIADFGEVAGAWDDRVRACVAAARHVLEAWSGGPDLIEFTLDGLDG